MLRGYWSRCTLSVAVGLYFNDGTGRHSDTTAQLPQHKDKTMALAPMPSPSAAGVVGGTAR
ncbi:MAG: hypothetical protein U1E76_16475 [Planctomycetota bacterium]